MDEKREEADGRIKEPHQISEEDIEEGRYDENDKEDERMIEDEVEST